MEERVGCVNKESGEFEVVSLVEAEKREELQIVYYYDLLVHYDDRRKLIRRLNVLISLAYK